MVLVIQYGCLRYLLLQHQAVIATTKASDAAASAVDAANSATTATTKAAEASYFCY